ncbi:hypothetical protein HNY73_013859 [Argiope bruennichi]|uniref:Uncharacterized protein n=1 Tax=Argiope bruennichi TaxID=94029 RepID=A0A8T0EM38_ARGBR|nr:hypothetical protein HNY73_013859 [Argiope bruennichi]
MESNHQGTLHQQEDGNRAERRNHFPLLAFSFYGGSISCDDNIVLLTSQRQQLTLILMHPNAAKSAEKSTDQHSYFFHQFGYTKELLSVINKLQRKKEELPFSDPSSETFRS